MKAVRLSLGLFCVISLGLLTACGQKGALTLPKKPTATQQPAPVETSMPQTPEQKR